MKKFLVSVAVILGFSAYALRGQFPKLGEEDDGKPLSANQNTALITLNTNSAGKNQGPLNTNSNQSQRGQFTNGHYIGSVADAFYGNIQLAITIAGGRLSGIQVLQYPNDQPHSVEVSNFALPILKSEAIQAQSAQVDTVSGATDTSFAFRESLQSALTQAGG